MKLRSPSQRRIIGGLKIVRMKLCNNGIMSIWYGEFGSCGDGCRDEDENGLHGFESGSGGQAITNVLVPMNVNRHCNSSCPLATRFRFFPNSPSLN